MEPAGCCNNDRFWGSIFVGVVDAEKGQTYKGVGSFRNACERRLSIGLLLETLEAYNVQWNVFLVPTTKNKADDLTQVPKHWLKNSADSVGAVALSARGGVEDTRLEAKDTKKIRGQGQGQPFRGQTLSRPRTQKKSEAKPKDRFPRTDTLEAKDRNARGQGPRTQAQVLSKKKKGLHKNFSGDLQKKKRSSQKFFKRSPRKNVFQKIFQALHKILTIQKILLSSSRGQANFRGLEASRPRTWPSRPRTSKCVLKDSTSVMC